LPTSPKCLPLRYHNQHHYEYNGWTSGGEYAEEGRGKSKCERVIGGGGFRGLSIVDLKIFSMNHELGSTTRKSLRVRSTQTPAESRHEGDCLDASFCTTSTNLQFSCMSKSDSLRKSSSNAVHMYSADQEISCFEEIPMLVTLLSIGRAIAQVVSRRLPNAAVRVRAQVRSCGICGGQSGIGAGFPRVLPFPLPILIPPIAPDSSSIIRGWYNRPVSD
jgi:hypothetical protein